MITSILSYARWLGVVAGLALAGCAGSPAQPQREGPGPEAVAAGQVQAHLKGLRKALESIPVTAIGQRELKVALRGSALFFDVPAVGSFEPGNAQLRIDALKPWAGVAEEAARWGAVVVQVRGLAGPDAESQSLAERRAASLAEFLVARGLAPGRVRHEHLLDPGRADRVELVLRAVVVGREPEAWMPPEVER